MFCIIIRNYGYSTRMLLATLKNCLEFSLTENQEILNVLFEIPVMLTSGMYRINDYGAFLG